MEVDIFIPCFIDQLYPESAFNMVKVLEKAGCKVNYNKNQTCCGQPAFNSGFWGDARVVGAKFMKDFDSGNPVVGPSGSCVGYVRNGYSELFGESSYEKSYVDLKGRIFEFSEFLVNEMEMTGFGAKFKGKATYHDACGALRECGIKEAPRKLLKEVDGLELVEMNDVETCCGFGGSFAVKYEPISIGMAEQKVENALEAGAEYLISTDLSCLLHLEGYIKKKGYDLQGLHIADVLASGW